MPKKRHNKQHDARAASFKRIAKALRGTAKIHKADDCLSATLNEVASAVDAEAKLLRSMR